MPTRYTLGRRFVRYGSASTGQNRPMKRKKDEMVYISLTNIIQKFAANDTFHSIIKYHDLQPGIYTSFEDGCKYRNDDWWKDLEESFHVKLYTDDVDMCDGLGSKASGQQKLLMIYCSLLDIDEIYQSSLLHHFIVGIARSEDVKRYGINKILKPILVNIKKFEIGVPGPDNTLLQGGLYATQGDNPAQNCICGYKEGFGRTVHPCRYCLAALSEIQIMTEENVHLLRNPQDHDAQVAEIEALEGEDRDELSIMYGINRRSILNEAEGFHGSQDALPDITHDIDLGILPRTFQNFYQKVILTKITLEELNRRIMNFDYGFSETKYKPSPLKAKHLIPGANIKQTAMQMETLAYMIPYIVLDIVEPNCPYFSNYKNLLEIRSIVFGYSISTDMVTFLRDSISEYLNDYANLYANEDGNAKFTPKQHFLPHYPGRIERFGPLRYFMCIRSEAKHQQSKRRVQGMRNYKNLPYTLLVRHQLWQALLLIQPLTKIVTTGPAKLEASETLPFGYLFPDELLQCTTNWINYNGVKYVSQKCLIAIGYANDVCLPQFAALYKILKRNRSCIYMQKSGDSRIQLRLDVLRSKHRK